VCEGKGKREGEKLGKRRRQRRGKRIGKSAEKKARHGHIPDLYKDNLTSSMNNQVNRAFSPTSEYERGSYATLVVPYTVTPPSGCYSE